MKKYLLLIFFITTIGCADLPQDNTLDPKNPDAEADQTAVVENFIMHYTNVDSIPNVVQYSRRSKIDIELYWIRLH